MKSTIRLTGIKAEGKHGANPGEQDNPQPLFVDVKIKMNVEADELKQTVDYEEITNSVKAHVADNSYKLIETLAYNIAAEISKLEKVEKVSVIVHKPAAAERLGADDVSAQAKVEGVQ